MAENKTEKLAAVWRKATPEQRERQLDELREIMRDHRERHGSTGEEYQRLAAIVKWLDSWHKEKLRAGT